MASFSLCVIHNTAKRVGILWHAAHTNNSRMSTTRHRSATQEAFHHLPLAPTPISYFRPPPALAVLSRLRPCVWAVKNRNRSFSSASCSSSAVMLRFRRSKSRTSLSLFTNPCCCRRLSKTKAVNSRPPSDVRVHTLHKVQRRKGQHHPHSPVILCPNLVPTTLCF